MQLLARQKSNPPEVVSAQPLSLLGGIYTWMDTEAFETPDTEGPELGRINTTYLMILTGDTVPAVDKLEGMLHFGDHQASTGELHEASKTWSFCSREAEEHPDPKDKRFISSRMCALHALDSLIQLDAKVIGHQQELWQEWIDWQQKSLQTSTSPELDEYFTAHFNHVLGIRAARHGDLSAAKDKLALISSSASSMLLPTEHFAAALELEIALVEGADAEKLTPLLKTLHQHTGSTCGDALRRAKVGQHLKQSTEVEQQLSTILNGKCIIDLSEQGLVLAEAQIWQAERLWKSDNAAARQLLTSFQQRWSNADPDLKLKLRAAALSKK